MNVSWWEAIPAVVAAAGWLVVAGVPGCYALGLRGIAAWATAPVISSLVLGVTALVASNLKIPWTSMTAVTGIIVFTGLALAGSLALAGQFGKREKPDPVRTRLAAAIGLATALLICSIITIRGFGAPDSLSWTWDTVFHYSALAEIRDSGDASPFTLAALGDPSVRGKFYPAAWFDIASLVVTSAGGSIPVAANATAMVVAALVWPLGCLFLARQFFGPYPTPLVITGGLGMSFGAFPWKLFYWGALWPYSLGQALVPIGLGLLLSATGLARSDTVGRGRASLILVPAIIGIGLAHPAGVFGLAVFGIFPVGWALTRWVLRQYRAGRSARGAGTVTGILVAACAAFASVSSMPLIEFMKDTRAIPSATSAGAAGEVLFNGTNGDRALWLVSALVLVGAVVALRRPGTRWIVAAHVAVGLLYVMTAAVQSPTTKSLTVFWFHDSYRLAAMLPVTGTLLAVLGVISCADSLRGWTQRRSWLLPVSHLRVVHLGPVVRVVLVIMVLTKGFYQGRHALTISNLHHSTAGLNELHNVSAALDTKLAFYQRIKGQIPDDAVVANQPEDASTLLWPLYGKRVLFPQIDESGNPKQQLLSQRLHQVASDPRVCQAVHDLRVRFLLIDPVPATRRNRPGLQDPANTPGFELVERNGPMKLYRITTCGAGGAANQASSHTAP